MINKTARLNFLLGDEKQKDFVRLFLGFVEILSRTGSCHSAADASNVKGGVA